MTREMAEAEAKRGGLNWLASSHIGPRIAFAPDDGGGSDAGEDGGDGEASSDSKQEAGEGDSEGVGEDKTQEAGEKPDDKAGKGEGGDKNDDPADDWRARIEDKQLRDFAGRFASPADLAKSAFELRQKLSKGLQPPGKDASDEERAAFRKAMGIPDDKSGYEFDMPEGVEATEADKAFHDRMAEVMHDAGVSAASAKALNKAWNEMTAAALAETERVSKEAREASHAALKKEWGKDFDGNFNLAKRVIKTHAAPEFIDFLEKTEVNGQKLGDHPDLIRVFGKIGRRMDESGFIGTVSEDERASVQDQISQLMRDNPPGTDKYKNPSVQKRLRELNEQLYGTGPIVGAGGRTN